MYYYKNIGTEIKEKSEFFAGAIVVVVYGRLIWAFIFMCS
ncbi:hypothetical protein SAMN04488500_102292 [Sporomusa malonica]|uniref:Uncharacterized protein n=1 Tax=Sporomusa malonica TaxID=112901 RepID=A0A1W1YXP1_9FIRM|nr:hypothetical protein SAMN04488500_102292 [Sporomusa malonica]